MLPSASTSIPVTITVNNLEEAGTVTLTLLQPQVGTAQTATLTDPDKNPSRVSWQWARGETSTGPFTNVSSGADPGSYTPVAADVDKFLRATATYDDGHGAGKSAKAVSANAVQAAPATNDAPVFSEDSASRSVAEDAVPGTDIGTPVTASDANSDTLTYSLGSDDAASFDIVPGTGQLQTKAALDFESDKKSYTVVVTATDPSGTLDTIMVTITVTNVDEAGTVTLSTVQPQVGTELTAMLEDTDGDPTSVTWQWGRGDTSTGPFPNISSGASYTPAAPDVGKFLQATATYTDPQGPGKTAHGVSAQAVQAAPDGPNSAPVFSSNTAIRSVAEDAIEGSNVGTPVIATDAANDTLTYSLAETDTAPLSIVQESGQLQTTAELDYETTPSYTVTVTATDPSGLVGSITVTISVGNVDEPGTVSISPSQPQVGTALTATLTDPDGTTSAVTWQWARGDTTGPYANVSSGASYTPVAADVGKFLQATATYTDPQGSGKSAAATTVNAVQAVPITNEAPEFPATTATRTVAENTGTGQDIGAPVAADDANTGDTLTYTLDGTDAGSFEIVSTNGQIKTKAGVIYDYEAAKNSYEVTVKADDYNGGTDTIDVTIDITNVDEAGTVTFNPTPPKAGTLLTATLTDLDGNVRGDTWEWLAADSATGTFTAITGATSNTYTPTVDDVGKFLKAKASYTDDEGSGKNAEATTTVGVTPSNTPPAFPDDDNNGTPNPITFSIAENSTAGASVGTVSTTDDDTGDTLVYSLEGTTTEKDAFNTAFRFDTSTSAIAVLADDSLDHETTSSYTFDIGVSDGKDAAGMTDATVDATVSVTINITDVNEAPTFDANLDDTLEVAENTPADTDIGTPFTATDPDVGDTLTYTLNPAGAAVFDIDASGQLKTKTGVTYDHETNPRYTVTVGVRDSLNEHGTIDTVTDDELDVTITVTNQDEPGTVTFTNPTPQARIELTASLGDPDVVAENSTTWQWSISDTSGNGFASIDAATDASYTPSDDDVGKYLRATATYTDGHGANKTAQGEPGNAVRVAHNPNQPPTFTEDPNDNPITFSIAENTPAGQDIGTPVTATDPDPTDTIAYSLGTPSASVFHIVSDTGQIQTKGSLDHETKATYTVTVTATDPSNESDTIAVTINVADVDEPPGKPSAPTVTATTNTHDTLTVTWDAPDNTGPAIDSYAVQYRKHDVTEWSAVTGPITGATNTIDITGLLPDTEYLAMVQATNDEGTGVWSDEGSGTTDAKLEADWFELVVDYSDATYDVTEGSSVDITVELSKDGTAQAADRKLAIPITDTGVNTETGDYTMSGLISGDLAFVPGESSKTFEISALRDNDGNDETVDLGFGSSLPTRVTDGTQNTATVTIDDNYVPPPPQRPPPPSNKVPSFPPAEDGRRTIAENTESGQNIGAPFTATDSDTLIYSLGGTDAASFTIDSGTGQLQTKGALDFEDKASYSVTVIATDPSNASDTITVTITVTDVDEPPGKPDAPTVAAKTGTHDTLTVTWDAPDNTGPDITSYAVQYRKHDVTGLTDATGTIDGTTTTFDITGLLPDTEYFARVQATNDEGTGDWSDEGSGTTDAKLEADWFELVVDYSDATYDVTEGSSVDITVELSKDGTAQAADRKLAIPITDTGVNTETGDYTVSGLTSDALAFVPGESSKTFEISALRDNDGDDETVDLGFGSTLPTKVTAGTLTASQVTIDDNYRRNSGGGGGGGSPPVDNPPQPSSGHPPGEQPSGVQSGYGRDDFSGREHRGRH